jgi:UDP-2,4-diacetamido-2,4,6-trideoxy-beta-L-altropyranose hydrolase
VKPRIVFRTDSSAEIGTGHVSRCLALAGELREAAETVFICRHVDRALGERIENEGHLLIRLPESGEQLRDKSLSGYDGWLGVDWTTDARDTLAAMARPGAHVDWLVVDHYALGARWQSAVRAGARRILVIDDLADRDHDCDLLLDQNLHSAPAERYRSRVGPRCRLLLGPAYALLRPEFALARAAAPLRRVVPERILLFMGGVDPADHTRKVIQAFIGIPRQRVVLEVVLGAGNPHVAALKADFGAHPAVELRVDVADMADSLKRADVAVGAGGIATWERCCLGVPSVTLSVAANQEPGARSLGALGATLYLGRAGDVDAELIQAALLVLLRADSVRGSLSAQSAGLVDGAGATRVARLLLGHDLHLRPAGIADRQSMLEWRNDARTREYSGDGTPISFADHARWFEASLSDPARKLLIAEENGSPIGVLRYDINGSEAEVSIYLVPGLAGRGLGTRLLAAGELWLDSAAPEVHRLRAEVRNDNQASLRLFEACGFERQMTIFRKELNGNV